MSIQRRLRRHALRSLLTAAVILAGLAVVHGERESESHVLGLYEAHSARLVIRNMEVMSSKPLFPGERFVLTTIGSEHESAGGLEFHPLVSVLVDYSFPEAPHGQWLALWNLGHKTPGPAGHVASMFPGLMTTKRVREGQLEKLEKRHRKLQENPARAGGSFPDPFLKLTQTKYRSREHLFLNGFKRGMQTIAVFWSKVGPIFSSANFLYRNYLLRHADRRDRQFEQAFLGLTWYTDLAYSTLGPDSLSAEEIVDLKFRLMASRHFFGRWVTRGEAEEFVHGFESKMRENLWGTSNYLASIANQNHLAYEEFHRYTAGGVPVALGGILYYDPALAPEPSQVDWPSFNPFDLTYNPFEDREVQKAASSGRRVPLAVYVYQSNVVFKPIIAVDFFDEDNPRTREAATYWHKLGDQALAVYSPKGLILWAANKSGSYIANRKGLPYLSDSRHSLGLEELRLSLMSHLYFEEEAADDLADSMDRLLINPLTQPTRIQAVRAQIQYLRLAQPDPLLRLGRRLQSNQIRKTTRVQGRVRDKSLERYRRYLKRRLDLKTLRIFLNDEHLPSVPPEQITRALDHLYEQARDPDPELVDLLMDLRLNLAVRPDILSHTIEWTRDIDRVLVRLYDAAGFGPRQLAFDLQNLETRKQRDKQKKLAKFRKSQRARFQRLTQKHLLVLKQFAAAEGDLMKVSPWYLRDSLEFFARAPLIIDLYPEAGIAFRKVEPRIIEYVNDARMHLALPQHEETVPWMENHRLTCLEAADLAGHKLAQIQRAQLAIAYAEKTSGKVLSRLQGGQP